jgi:hypothetical protein
VLRLTQIYTIHFHQHHVGACAVVVFVVVKNEFFGFMNISQVAKKIKERVNE